MEYKSVEAISALAVFCAEIVAVSRFLNISIYKFRVYMGLYFTLETVALPPEDGFSCLRLEELERQGE
ncbi:hypothetical protein ABEW34_04445 [Paenibacillus algorifonticola]|uniref:hypothetical protein n=1 Tax=Paenibacillus algorifonticola TaxID=684063 RepID=UPI003D26750E